MIIGDPITTKRLNFNFALGDVKILLRFHDAETGRGKGRPARELEVFKRAGLILAVTAWETFIEDTIADGFKAKLSAASSPSAVESTFRSVAQAWLARGDKIKPEELSNWALDGWRAMLMEKFILEIESLNTPNSRNIRELSKKYLGSDITKNWRWQSVSARVACERLDTLIRLRGRLVHRGREFFEGKAGVRRYHVVNGIALLERLADLTEAALEKTL